MEYVALGRSDLQVSRIGFGCAGIGGYDYGAVDDRESIAAIERALDLEITLFDTADVYGLGHSEVILGRALGARRHNVVVATKVGVAFDSTGRTWHDLSPGHVVAALEGSLRRLRLDSIPLYQIHWPDPRTPIVDTMEALARCREHGKIQHIGCCNYSETGLAEVVALEPMASHQLAFSLLEPHAGGVIAAGWRRFSVSGLSHSSLAHGLLSGRYGADAVFGGSDLRQRSPLFEPGARERGLALVQRLHAVGRRHGRTVAQVALRWLLDQPGVACALAGSKRAAQVEENAGATDWKLDPADLALLAPHAGVPGDPRA